jgi:hypothetical protein
MWWYSGVRCSVLCWWVWQESGFSRREDVYFIKKFYKFCTFNAISKNIVATNSITLQNKSGTLTSTLTRLTPLVCIIIPSHYETFHLHILDNIRNAESQSKQPTESHSKQQNFAAEIRQHPL